MKTSMARRDKRCSLSFRDCMASNPVTSACSQEEAALLPCRDSPKFAVNSDFLGKPISTGFGVDDNTMLKVDC